MRIHHLYEDGAGESHWGDLQVDWAGQSVGGRVSSELSVKYLQYYEMPDATLLDWHAAPRRQYVIHLDGKAVLTASDGESRTIEAGDVVLLEDVTGKGHLSRNLTGKPYHCLFLALD